MQIIRVVRMGLKRVILFFLISIGTIMSCRVENGLLVRVIGKHYHKKWFFAGTSKNETTTVPFEIINGWIVVKVQLNDLDTTLYRFVFDTGAITMIEPELASELKLTHLKDFTKTDINGVSHSGYLINLNNLKIGERNFYKIGAISSHTELFSCYNIKGIFGYNLISNGIYHIDFEKQIILISQLKNDFDIENFNSIKIDTDWRRMMYVKLRVGKKNVKAVLDTGAPNYLILNESLKSEFKADHLLQKRAFFLTGANSSVLDTLSVYRPHNLKLSEVSMNKDIYILTKTNSYVGTGFLKGFQQAVIDMKNRKLYLSKKQIGKNTEYKITNLNIGWKDGAVRITGLSLGSGIQKMGLKMGDQIAKINDADILSFKDDCTFKVFESSNDIYNKNMELLIMREGKSFEFSINKTMIND